MLFKKKKYCPFENSCTNALLYQHLAPNNQQTYRNNSIIELQESNFVQLNHKKSLLGDGIISSGNVTCFCSTKLSVAEEPKQRAGVAQKAINLEGIIRAEEEEGEEGTEKSNLQLPKLAHLGFQAHPTVIPRRKAIQTGPKNIIIPMIIPPIVGLLRISKNASATATPIRSSSIMLHQHKQYTMTYTNMYKRKTITKKYKNRQ